MTAIKRNTFQRFCIAETVVTERITTNISKSFQNIFTNIYMYMLRNHAIHSSVTFLLQQSSLAIRVYMYTFMAQNQCITGCEKPIKFFPFSKFVEFIIKILQPYITLPYSP